MEFKNINLDKKIKRKNFFFTMGMGIAGYAVLRSFLFRLFTKKSNSNKAENNNNSRVKINPLAVSRKNTGGNNV